MVIEVYCDGGARGNPGAAAVGVSATAQSSRLKAQGNIFKISKYIGIATNNQAEYQSVIEALQWVVENIPLFLEKPERIKLFLDSKLVVNQLNGIFKVKNPHLRELLLRVRILENQIEIPVAYHYIAREKNRDADRLVNEALNSAVVSN